LKRSQQQIGKRNRRAGKQFETRVAKLIAKAFGWDYKGAFDRAGAGHEQAHDAITLSPFSDSWPFWWECKYRQGWSFAQFFKSPETAAAVEWFEESITYTAEDRLLPGMALSKPWQPIYWMTTVALPISKPVLSLRGKLNKYYLYKLDDVLEHYAENAV
jgi:hypothetical protein